MRSAVLLPSPDCLVSKRHPFTHGALVESLMTSSYGLRRWLSSVVSLAAATCAPTIGTCSGRCLRMSLLSRLPPCSQNLNGKQREDGLLHLPDIVRYQCYTNSLHAICRVFCTFSSTEMERALSCVAISFNTLCSLG